MFNIVVLVSGNGSNLQAIIDAVAAGLLVCNISMVIADRSCYAIERANKYGISTTVIPRAPTLSNQITTLIPITCNLIVLAGFLSILNTEFVQTWHGKIINIHPSLLPKYGGLGFWGIKVHQAVIANQDTHSGCTVHLVSAAVDCGKILLQRTVAVLPDDTAVSLQQKVQALEPDALIAVIKQFIAHDK
jgi:phosphoribosylglycinamide formyltransferase 1